MKLRAQIGTCLAKTSSSSQNHQAETSCTRLRLRSPSFYPWALPLPVIFIFAIRLSDMSTLWTPSGERPIRRPSPPSEQPTPARSARAPEGHGASGDDRGPDDHEDASLDEEELRRVRDHLAATPADVVIANHAYGIFELAGLHLSLDPPQLDQARLCIDAFALLVDGLGDRLGDPASQLREALSQLRLAFVAVASASGHPTPAV
jgi:hypothetical protein